jgi:thiol-disulfide isomerase/thioredoxin
MKLKYPILIGLLFIVVVLLNNEMAKHKKYNYYRDIARIDDPIRQELRNNKRLNDEAEAKTLVINLWATWCGPCQREIPELNKLVGKFESENVLFLSVTSEKEKDVLAWIDIQKNEPEYFQMFENDRLLSYLFSLNPDKNIKSGRAPQLLPTNLIIHDGKLVYFKTGYSDGNIEAMDSVLNTVRDGF